MGHFEPFSLLLLKSVKRNDFKSELLLQFLKIQIDALVLKVSTWKGPESLDCVILELAIHH